MKILLNEIMAKKNLNERQIEIMTGIPRSSVGDIKNGKSSPRMDTMEKLAKALKVRIIDLFDSPYK